MAETTLATGSALTVKRWLDTTFEQYLDALKLAPYMGTDSNAMVQVNEELTKNQGDAVTFPLMGALSGEGIQGDGTLEGNEEALNFYSQQVVVDLYRNAVRVGGKMTEQRYPFEIRDKAKPSLLNWKQQFDEQKAFTALGSIDGIAYSSASEGQKDTWLTNNADRVLFGASVANNAANDHSAALAEVDGTNDILTPAQISLAKRLARLATPKIRPIRIQNGSEVFVMFVHPFCARDLFQSTDWKAAQREAMPRGTDNPIFTGATGMWDGVIVVETEKVRLIPSVGASGIGVAQNLLCGAQALLWALGGVNGGKRMDFVEETFDYKNKVGVAIESMYGIAKARFATGASSASQDHGVVTVYSAAVAD